MFAYRRIMGFFGGAMSESSEENQELNQGKYNEALDAAGEQGAVLRNKVHQLENELKERTKESEGYKNRLRLIEKELEVLKTSAISQPAKTSTGVGDNIIHSKKEKTPEKESPATETANIERLRNENSELREELNKTKQLLKDKTELCENQERQNLALTNQIVSLKEVVAITKDLLNIRNMEVQHLQTDVDSMEGKIAEERDRHNSMITKMDEAVKLNSDLKKEYETQLKIFQDLKSKYEEKVSNLTKENEKLEQILSSKSASSQVANAEDDEDQ